MTQEADSVSETKLTKLNKIEDALKRRALESGEMVEAHILLTKKAAWDSNFTLVIRATPWTDGGVVFLYRVAPAYRPAYVIMKNEAWELLTTSYVMGAVRYSN